MSIKNKRRPAAAARRKSTDRYRLPKYVEYIFFAEMSILSADTVLPNLTDGEAVAALKNLVAQIHKIKGLPHYPEQPTDTEGMIAWLIIQNWTNLFNQKRKLSRKEMVGCLGVVIESAESRMRKPNQRKYLSYLKKFMKRAGVSLKAISASELEEDEPDDEVFYDLDGMSLPEVGRLWLLRPDIWGVDDAFENKAHMQIAGGEAQAVASLCQELLPQTDAPYIQAIFYTVQGKACRRLGRIDQAIELLTTARRMNSDYLGSRHELAKIYYEQENYEQAIWVWRECLIGDRLDLYVYRQIAGAYRQMGDLAGEEQTWRDLLKVQERRGCLPFLVKFLWRYRSISTLAYLADCLERQGKTAELNQVLAQIDRSQPHPKDSLTDWAYWVRYRLERSPEADQVLVTLRSKGPLMFHSIWSDLLQACVYDWLEQPRQAASLWQKVKQEVPEPQRAGLLSDVYEILGPILPPSSRLITMDQKEIL